MSRWSLCALLAVAVYCTAALPCLGQGANDPFSDEPAATPLQVAPSGFNVHSQVVTGGGPLATPLKAAPATPQPKKRKGDSPIFAGTKIGTVPRKAAPVKEQLRTGEAAIEQALDEPTSFEFVETPLDQVIEFFKDKHHIEIQLDRTAMDDVGIQADAPVTKSIKGVSLRSALNLVLRELKMTFMIEHEVLLITTPETAEGHLTTRVYDVADLVVCLDDKLGRIDDYDSLIDAITSTIIPTSWDTVGGPGSIARGSLGTAKVLIISQTYEVHREIADLLEKSAQWPPSIAEKGCHAASGSSSWPRSAV